MWKKLHKHAEEIGARHLHELFSGDEQRFERLHRRTGPLLYDFSRQRLTGETLELLFRLADERELGDWIERLYSGERINSTEDRAAMHWALRMPDDSVEPVAGQTLLADVQAQLERMERIVAQLHAGQWRGCTGEVIRDVVNIGVGGSDLGPLMISRALEDHRAPDARELSVHFVSSMDGSQVSHLLHRLRPETTLFVISSKSFTTVDTLYNAATAHSWLSRAMDSDDSAVLRCHFLGVSAQPERMSRWGIRPENQLRLWDWVGGRYSVWSAIGLPVALITGMEGFRELLAGAWSMDRHFRTTPWRDNIPVLMALIGVWNTNFLDINAHAILPYDGRLKYLPAFLEQLEMESNGKSVTRDGRPVESRTCPIIWGDVGPNAQHAFYQLLHQGTEPVTCDFIAPVLRYREGRHDAAQQELLPQHDLALANCLAQSRLLALGEKALPETAPTDLFRRYHGNQPSATILLDELNPYSMGALVALYEHKVFTQSVIWGINPFDQWGVEMGKEIARSTLDMIRDGGQGREQVDGATLGLVDFIRRQRKGEE